MRYLRNLIYLAKIILIVNLIVFASCSQRPPSPLGKTSIEEKFLNGFNKSARLEYPVYASTNITGKTFWIYVATEKDLWTFTGVSSVGGVIPEDIIKFSEIKCNYENSIFFVKYIFLKNPPEDKDRDIFKKPVGGTSIVPDFTNETYEILEKTYAAIGDIISEVERIDFFAICIANIKGGTKMIFATHRLDTEQYLLGMLPSDEFNNRMIFITEGNKDIINDKYGLHMKYNDISLIDFLREQIEGLSRAKLSEMEKYEPEKLKAIEKLDDILLKSVYEVTTKYEFNDYILVDIENIITKEKLSISKSRLLNKFEQG